MASELLGQIRLHGDVPRHVAIIMDGNGRWARGQGLPRPAGHREGMKSVREGVEVHVLGELDRVDAGARRAVDALVDGTRGGRRMRLNLMISYGAREEIVRAARMLAEKVARGEIDPAAIDESAFEAELFTGALPDPDLLIRTSGEFRLSNFLLWQLAYTELHVTSVLWPDFTREDLYAAVRDYQRRERRFGRVQAG